MPTSRVVYHSIMGNKQRTTDQARMTDGIVPYQSSHLDHAQSELIIQGGHSIPDHARGNLGITPDSASAFASQTIVSTRLQAENLAPSDL